MQKKIPHLALIFSILFLLASLAAFFFFFREIGKNIEKAQTAETEFYAENLRRSEIEVLNKSVKKIEVERAELEKHFARSSDIVPFLDTIEGLAKILATKIEISSVEVLENYTGLLVGLKTSGSFANFYKFITLLENSSYELEIISMDMHAGELSNVASKATKSRQWDVLLKIKLLSFVQ